MAVRKHVDILSRGVRGWNSWRRAFPKLRPDLSGVDLRRANLRGVDFRKTRLVEADLRRADLTGARLDSADVGFADLHKAVLRGASLRRAHCLHSGFDECDLRDAEFREATLSNGSGFGYADFRNSNLRAARYLPSHLEGANLSGLDLSNLDLSDADCRGANLSKSNLTGTDLRGADLSGAYLVGACLDRVRCDASYLMRTPWHDERELLTPDADGDMPSNTRLEGARLRAATFRGATLTGIQMRGMDCSGVDFTGAILRKAALNRSRFVNAVLAETDLRGANLSFSDLSHADLEHSDLRGAFLVNTNLSFATISSSRVYGVSAWDVRLRGTEQENLVITRPNQPEIKVDDLEIAQFLHVIIDNDRIRNVIDSIATRVVLILGRFTPARMEVLDAVRLECRKHGLVPVLFDFTKPKSRNLTETITTLARLARFVIVDITYPRSVPQELYAIVPHLPSVPVQPLVLAKARTYGMFEDLRNYPWVLPPFRYTTRQQIRRAFETQILLPMEAALRR